MKTIWLLIFLIVAFGIVGRIDYEAELASVDMRIADRKWAAEVAASQVAR